MIRKFEVTVQAYLIANAENEVSLCIGSLAYAATDIAPQGLFVAHRLIGSHTAGYFVTQIMMRRFGNNIEQWPDLAREFVSMESAPSIRGRKMLGTQAI